MMFTHQGQYPRLDPSAYVAPTATICGDVATGMETMARLLLLVALPALRMWSILLIRRQSIHPVLPQDAMDGRTSHGHLVKPL